MIFSADSASIAFASRWVIKHSVLPYLSDNLIAHDNDKTAIRIRKKIIKTANLIRTRWTGRMQNSCLMLSCRRKRTLRTSCSEYSVSQVVRI